MYEGAAFRAATVEKKRWLQQCLQYEKECEVMQFGCSFLFFSFLLKKRTFSAQDDVFDWCCIFFFVLCFLCRWRKSSLTLREDVCVCVVCGCEQNMI